MDSSSERHMPAARTKRVPAKIEPKPRRYECRWPSAEAKLGTHYWVDHEPTEAHWRESLVMRWDLRDDWHLIWPEMINHPCALLFAPTHPDRVGPRRFRDWLESWPAGFDWERKLPDSMHDAIRAELAQMAREVQSGPVVEEMPAETQDTSNIASAEEAPYVAVSEVIDRLAALLCDVPDHRRRAVASNLETLVRAPDSSRTINALKTLLTRGL